MSDIIKCQQKHRVTIVLLTYNGLEETTRPCVESIYKHTPTKDFQLVIVDNMSTDGTREYLKKLERLNENITLQLNNKNEGYATGNNLGIALAETEYIILLNNDTLVTPNWLQTILRPFIEDPSVGIVGPVTNSAGNEQCIDIPGLTEKNYIELSAKHCSLLKGHKFETHRLSFFCIATTAEFFSSVGLLDENFGIGMFEDDDLCMRGMRKHWSLVVVEDCFIFHKGSASFSKLSNEAYKNLFENNRSYFDSKHGHQWFFTMAAITAWTKIKFDFDYLKDSESPAHLNKIKVRAKLITDSLYQVLAVEQDNIRRLAFLQQEILDLNAKLDDTQRKLGDKLEENGIYCAVLKDHGIQLQESLRANQIQKAAINKMTLQLEELKAYRIYGLTFGVVKFLRFAKRLLSAFNFVK